MLARDSLMDILARFLHLQTEETQVATDKGIKRPVKETLVFPRYHQLDCVRQLVSRCAQRGAGAQLPDPAFGRIGQIELHRLARPSPRQPA